MKYWTGGSYLLFKSNPMGPKDTLLVNIHYKYNSWKVLSFTKTEGSGRTKPGITY